MSPLPLGTTTYERAPLNELVRAGGVCVDLHYHTRYSDGSANVDTVLRRAARLGVGVAITDHNEVRGSLEAWQRAEGRVFVIPGIEVNCWEGRDLLVYFASPRDLIRFYESEVAPYRGVNPSGRIHRGLVHVAEGAKRFGGVVSAAHPFGMMGRKNLHRWVQKNGATLLESIDAIESNNGSMRPMSNLQALGWSISTGKPMTGGSDGHTRYELGQVVTWAAARTPGEFLDALLAKETAVIGKKLSPLLRLGPASMVFRRHFLYVIPGLRRLVRRFDPRAALARLTVRETHPEIAAKLAGEQTTHPAAVQQGVE